MATVAVRCPHCRTSFAEDDASLGVEAPCPHCLRPFVHAPLDSASSRSSPWPWVSAPADEARTAPVRPADGLPTPAVETWRPGDVILDLYEVREVFTSGGRGLVYRVRHRGWNMDLAVKCPRPEYFRDELDKEDFEQEAETWVKLGLHPHTVACYYVRRLGGTPRVFAEYVAGGSLDEWVRTRRLYRGGPETALERVLDVAIQVAWGLQHAHDQNLVHRDVKPGNVLLTDEGLAKVTDFGMAKARGGRAEAAAGVGGESILVSAGGMTPAYCSPEQAQGHAVSRKTDVWSWGVSLLAMFTGGTQWTAGFLAGLALEEYLQRGPAEGLPRMPGDVLDLLRECFRRDPDARPRDMREVAAVLQDVYAQLTGGPYRRKPPHAAKALADGLNNRAVSLRDLNKLDEAERLWEEALAAGPHHPESTYNLGLTRWRAGRLSLEALLQQLQEVCVSHPGDWLPVYLTAMVHLEQGNWRQAAEMLEKLVVGAGAGQEEVRTALAAARERLANAGHRVRTFRGHTGWASSACASADGRWVLSGSADGTLKLWEAATGRCLRTFAGHTEWVTSVGLSGDGRRAVSGSADRTLRLWDVASGRCLRVFHGHTNWVLAVALSPDGRHVLSASGDCLLKVWDAETGECLRSLAGHSAAVLSACWSADGEHILSGSRDRTLIWWDAENGECLRQLAGHADKVHAVALSGDGRLALSGGADRAMRLWDVESGQCLQAFEGHQGGVTSVCLSADGRHAVSGGEDRAVKFWRTSGGRCVCTLEGHAGTVHSVCLTGGRHAVSASADQTLALWRLPPDLTAPYLLSRVLPSDTALAAWTDYERALAKAKQALAGGDAARAARYLREARSQPGYGRRPEAMGQWSGLYVRLARKGLEGGWEGNTFAGHADAVTCACLSGDGALALSGGADRTLRLWEIESGQCLQVFEGHTSGVTSACLTADARFALSGSADGTLRLWDVATGQCVSTCAGEAPVITSVALSADGRLALAGGTDGGLRLWEVLTGRLLRVLRGHNDSVHSVCLSGDGRVALSGSAQFLVRTGGERLFTSGQLRLWDVAAGRPLPAFEGHADAVTAVALSADGRHALSGGGQAVLQRGNGRFVQSGRVHLWEVATGRRLNSFTGHAGAVTSVCLSFDGRYALSGSTDRAVKLWDVETGACLRTFAGHADAVTAVALSADGRHALSGSADRTLKLWALDWELEDSAPADWDDGAMPYLDAFLARHTPYAAPLPARKRSLREAIHLPLGRLFKSGPSGDDITRSLTREGHARWTEKDFDALLYALGCAGFGWLRPEGVRRRLERRARERARSGPA